MLERIQRAVADGRFLSGPHTKLRQLEWGITDLNVRVAVGNDAPEVIEDYSHDERGPCCLIRGEDEDGVLHVLCTDADPVSLVTVYRPDPHQWYPSFRRRR